MKKSNIPFQICTSCVMDTTDSKIQFDSNGVCDYCNNFKKNISPSIKNLKKNFNPSKLRNQIKSLSKNKSYDCLIGISGGVDSCFLVDFVVKKLELRPALLHVDTGWNSKESTTNIEKIVDNLNLDLFTQVINWDEMRDLQLSFIKAQIANLDIPQDHAIFGSIYKFAIKNKIFSVVNGGNYSTECIREPLEWAYHASDLKLIKNIHEKYGSIEISSFPFCDIFQYRIFYRFFYGLKIFQPLNYFEYNKKQAIKTLKESYNFLEYSQKHFESRFTRFFEGYWLIKKFGFDKRKAHFSSLILTEQMERDEALKQLSNPPLTEDQIRTEFDFVCRKLNISSNKLNYLLEDKNCSFADYKNNYFLIQMFVKLSRYLKLENRLIR